MDNVSRNNSISLPSGGSDHPQMLGMISTCFRSSLMCFWWVEAYYHTCHSKSYKLVTVVWFTHPHTGLGKYITAAWMVKEKQDHKQIYNVTVFYDYKHNKMDKGVSNVIQSNNRFYIVYFLSMTNNLSAKQQIYIYTHVYIFSLS